MSLRIGRLLPAACLVMAACGGRGQSGPVADLSPLLPAGVDSLFAAGQRLYGDGAYDSARVVWTQALLQAGERSGQVARAVLLTEIGLANWRLGNLAEAERLEREAITLKAAAGHHELLSRSHNALGLILWDAGRLPEAGNAFEEAIRTAQVHHDRLGVIKAAGNLGLVYGDLGELARARRAYRDLRQAGRALDSARLEANGLSNEASLDVQEGDPDAAVERLDTALALYRRIGYATGTANALGQLATAHELTGQYERAFTALDSAVVLARRLGLRGEEGENLALIAEVHSRLGDWRRAARTYEQADRLLAESGNEGRRANARLGMATAYLALGNLGRADSLAREARRLAETAEQPGDQLLASLVLAETARRLEGPAQARLVLAEAHRLAERLQTRTARLSVALADARLADASADPAGALRALRASASEVRPGDAWAEWEVEALTARAFARTNQLDSAVAAGRRAVAAVERVRGNLGSTTLRSIVVAQRAAVYGDLVLALLAQGRADEAFTVADAARSRSLIEHLGEARGERGVPRQAVEADALLRRIDYLLQQLRDTEQPGRAERGAAEDHLATQLESELATARDRYEGLVARRSDGEAATGGLLGLTAPRLDDVRAALRPGEVLLAYLLTDSVVVTFVVRRDGLNVVRAHVTKETIGHQVRLVRDLWSRPGSDWQRAMPAATALYRTLVQPAEDAGLLRDATRLVVVPHGVLGQVPFAALPHPLSGEFLVRRYVVTTLPLSSGLSALRSRSVDISSQAHALAIAPFPDELPASREEAEAVTVARLQVRVRLGASATEAMVRRALGQGSVVHLATHGVLNARNPMFSRVELARGSGRTADDGRLEVHELFGLVIQSPLVFFSGCETGAEAGWSDDPSQHGGELSLAQATLTAGAANVISTLWRIDDAGAASFAGRFYRGLVGRLLTDAFAEAQRGLATDVRYVSPYYWAGYLFSGQDGQLGPQTGGPRSVSSSTPTDVRRPSRR